MATIYDFDQFGRIWQRRSNDDVGGAVTPSTTGVQTRSGERISGVYRYTVSSTAGRSATGLSTAGWTRKVFDGEGRLLEEAVFSGDAIPAPWGSTTTSNMGATTMSYTNETTTVTDPSGRIKTTAVDPLGRLASVDEGGVSNATYAYTALDSLTGVTQTDSSSYTGTVTQSRTFLYTSLNRLKSATNPESGTTTYTYYAGGSLNTKVDARPVTTTHSMDGLKRVTSKSYNDGKTPAVSYCYDGKMYVSGACASVTRVAPDFPMGRLTGYGSQVDGADAGRNYSRIDGLGRVLESRQRSAGSASGEYVFQYGYQLDGALTQVNYPSGRVVTYTTSDRSLPTGLTTATGTVSGALYEPDGQLKSATIGPFSQTWAHNSRGQMTGTTATGSGSVKLFAMTLDYGTTTNNGNVWAETVNPDNVPATLQYFRYDNANRLRLAAENPPNPSLVDSPSPTCAQIGGTWCHRYGFDVFGNAWQTDMTGTAPGLKANGPAWFLQGTTVSNRMTGQLYDNAGNLQQYEADTAKRAEYDAEGRVTKTTDVVSGTTVTTGEYWYDGEGLRVKKRVSGVTTWFACGADGEVMAEYQVGGAATASGVQYLVTDHLGSTRVLVAGDGSVAGRLNYTPFGAELGTVSGLTARKFTGKERDAETGLDYFGARYFSGAQGRFITPDWSAKPEPVPYSDLKDPQTLNLYSYVRNNPLSRADLDGHCDGVASCLWSGLQWAGGTAAAGAAVVETATVAAAGAIGGAIVYLASPEVPGAIPSPNPGHQFAMSQDAVSNGTANTYARDANENYVPSGKQGQAQQGQQSTPADPNDKKGPKAADAPGVSAGGQATDQYGNKLGPSGKPMVNETNSNTREGARNRAVNEGSGATEHSNPTRGKPHFHPTDAQGEKKPNSTHHNYPDNR